MSRFEEIRPYNDAEVRPAIDKLINDNEFVDVIIKLGRPKFGRFLSPFIRGLARKKIRETTAGIHTVADLQAKSEFYLKRQIDRTIAKLSISGLDRLDKNAAYLFVSNHRDIAMDPAMVNWSLFQNDFSTIRIAIGDNLLTKPFASHLMRLNKCFIVKRSAKSSREKFKAAKLLSEYIHHSVKEDNENVWIAQREGRAKDGIDISNQAILSMFALSKPKAQSFGDFIVEAKIVPVTISYEYDPCDEAKAQELYEIEKNGSYTKGEQEDVRSIARGIVGYKGNVHLHFGELITQQFENAEQVKEYLDDKILDNYVLHPSHCIAYEYLEKTTPKLAVGEAHELFDTQDFTEQRHVFTERLDKIPEALKETFLKGYANPVYRKLEKLGK